MMAETKPIEYTPWKPTIFSATLSQADSPSPTTLQALLRGTGRVAENGYEDDFYIITSLSVRADKAPIHMDMTVRKLHRAFLQQLLCLVT